MTACRPEGFTSHACLRLTRHLTKHVSHTAHTQPLNGNITDKQNEALRGASWDLPGDPVVKTTSSHCRGGHGFDPQAEN